MLGKALNALITLPLVPLRTKIGIRLTTTFLLTAVLVLGIWTFVMAKDHGWWLPPQHSSYGQAVDNLFYLILWMVGVFFVLTEGVLVYCVFKYSAKRDTKATFTHGNHRLELLWTFIPALLLLLIAFSQMSTWAEMKFEGGFPKQPPIARVWASQFDWHFVYPGRDGEFGTSDDLDTAFEFVVPVDEPVVFELRSRDVIHSFFVPLFRLKQDAMPGLSIPVWFKAEKTGVYDLVCAELCGWGHYKMAGRVRVLSRPDYDKWLEDLEAHHDSNGSEERS